MKTIQEDVTIQLQPLQRSALRSLLDSGPVLDLDELLQGVLMIGLAQLLEGRPLPEVSKPLEEKAQAVLGLVESRPVKGLRVTADYLGFPIDAHQRAALDDLLATYSHLSEDEVCRILLDCGLKNAHGDPSTQELLRSTRPGTAPVEGDQS